MNLFTLLLCCSAALSFVSRTTARLNTFTPPSHLTSRCKKAGTVALTIDDGPDYHTEEILSILKTKNVSATFFLLGKQIDERVVRDPIDLIDKIMNDGHQVALHGYTHQNYDLMTYDAIHEDLTKTSDLIHTFGKVRPAFVRVPYDKCSTANCTKVLSDMGLTRIHYNVDSSDWENAYRNDTPSHQDKVLRPEDESTKLSMERLNGILKEADPKHDSIILLHHETFPFVLKLIPKVIDTIRAKGFTFVPLAECLGQGPYKECQFTSTHPYHLKTHHDSTTTPTNSTPSQSSTPTPTPTHKGGAQVHNVAAWTFGLGAILAYALA